MHLKHKYKINKQTKPMLLIQFRAIFFILILMGTLILATIQLVGGVRLGLNWVWTAVALRHLGQRLSFSESDSTRCFSPQVSRNYCKGSV